MIIDGLSGGGAEKVVLNLCQGIKKIGHQVYLISLKNICQYSIPNEINYQVIIDNYKKPWRKLTELSRRALALEKIIHKIEYKHGKFDLIFSHLHKTDRIVSHTKLYTSNRLWFCLHGVLSIAYLNHRRGINRWIKKRKITSIYQGRNIIVVSKEIGNDLKKNLSIIPKKLIVINNPFNINDIKKKQKEPCNLKGKDYILHIGRFHQHKRHDRLLKSYLKSGIKAPLFLIGTGNKSIITNTKILAKKLNISNRIHFLGFQINPYPFIYHASLLVLSSDHEGFGNVLIESLLCNTPIVSTLCPGGVKEILKKNNMSHALSELNEFSLSNKMSYIYYNPPKINQKKLLIYDIDFICKKYLQVKNK